MIEIPVKKAKNLKEAIAVLDIDEVRDFCNSKVFSRGESYFANGTVSEIEFSADLQTLTATVEGSEDYTIILQINKSAISTKCNCLYGGLCKHIIAVLLYAIEDGESIEIATAPNKESSTSLEDYLQSLSKEQLIGLVTGFAPESFRTEIRNRFSGKEDALTIYLRVQKSIEKIFKNENLLHSPSAFEQALMKQVSQLKNLEHQIPCEIGDLILFIIKEIDDGYDEGYFYTDHYNDEEYFSSEDFENFVLDYLKGLSFKEKTDYLMRLEETLHNQSYDTFSGLLRSCKDAFTAKDFSSLKSILINSLETLPGSLTEQYYQATKTELSKDEEEKVLKSLCINKDHWILELVDFYEKNLRLTDAAQVLKKHIDENKKERYWGGDKYYLRYIDILVKNKKDITDVSFDAITACHSSEILGKIAAHIKDTSKHETILEKLSVSELLEYFQLSGRIGDAFKLIKQHTDIDESDIYGFYKKHKMEFPEDSKVFFRKQIDKNLEYASETNYYNIADLLRQIKPLDQKMLHDIVADIRKNYNRRRNLIKHISGF